MDAFVHEDTVYFSTKEKIAFARYSSLIQGKIESGSAKELPQGKQKFNLSLKRYHAAEHKVYNSFKAKIHFLKDTVSREELYEYLPSLAEAKRANSFSIFCGSTQAYFILSTAALFTSLNLVLNNLISFIISLALALGLIYLIQKYFFLAEPSEKELKIALAALNELLKGEEHELNIN